MKTVLATLLVTFLLAVVAGAAVLASGVYNVAATEHTAPVEKLLATMTRLSIQNHAKDIVAPDLEQSAWKTEGAHHYAAMCVTCHGAPGVPRSEIGQGLYPPGPGLAQTAEELSPAEIYWVVKNGIKMTGMPAFGATHAEDALWAIVGFVTQLPTMAPEKYQELTVSPSTEGEHEHAHDAQPSGAEATAPAPEEPGPQSAGPAPGPEESPSSPAPAAREEGHEEGHEHEHGGH